MLFVGLATIDENFTALTEFDQRTHPISEMSVHASCAVKHSGALIAPDRRTLTGSQPIVFVASSATKLTDVLRFVVKGFIAFFTVLPSPKKSGYGKHRRVTIDL